MKYSEAITLAERGACMHNAVYSLNLILKRRTTLVRTLDLGRSTADHNIELKIDTLGLHRTVGHERLNVQVESNELIRKWVIEFDLDYEVLKNLAERLK